MAWGTVHDRAACALCAAVLGCSSSDHAPLLQLEPAGTPARPSERIPERGQGFTPHDCWVNLPKAYAVDCGTVITAAHHEAGQPGETVALAVAVVYSNGARVAPEPVIYLDGGPGAGSLNALLGDSIPFTSILEDHDLILFDQRGTGFSWPRSSCDLPESAVDTAGAPTAVDAGSAGGVSSIADCRARTIADGLDLSMFRSAENAADADAVRKALGYSSFDLYGTSYGTRYALTVLRDHPEAVRVAVIDSVVPLQIDLVAGQGQAIYRAIHLISSTCSAEPDCAAIYGNIEAKELAALERMNARPPRVSLDDGSTAVVPAEVAASLFISFMYSRETISLLPELVQEVSDGDYSVFAKLYSSVAMSSSLVDIATYLSVTCADEVPFSSKAALDAGLAAVPESWRRWVAPGSVYDSCRIWDVPPSPPVENEAVTSDVRTLVTSGQFDPVTPPDYGALAASTLSRSRTELFAGEAHGSSFGDCGKKVVRAYLDDPAGPMDDSCKSHSLLSFQSLGAPVPDPVLVFDTNRRRPPAGVIDRAFRKFPFPIWR